MVADGATFRGLFFISTEAFGSSAACMTLCAEDASDSASFWASESVGGGVVSFTSGAMRLAVGGLEIFDGVFVAGRFAEETPRRAVVEDGYPAEDFLVGDAAGSLPVNDCSIRSRNEFFRRGVAESAGAAVNCPWAIRVIHTSSPAPAKRQTRR